MNETNPNKEIVIYTAIAGGYDTLRAPRFVSERCDHICFSDAPERGSKIWRIEPFPDETLSPHMRNRKVKILPHHYLSQYQYSVYVDGNVEILGDLALLVDEYLARGPFAAPRHHSRNCFYVEAEECIRQGKADPDRIRQQVDAYREEGFPAHFGLTDNSVLLRRHGDPAVIDLMEAWWHELNTQSPRDQLCLGYVLWKKQHEMIYMDENVRIENAYISRRGHKSPGIKGVWQSLTARYPQLDRLGLMRR